jgi:hypothetical protein
MWLRARASLQPGEANQGGLRLRPVFGALAKSIAACLPALAFLYGFLSYTGAWWRQGSTLANLGLLALAGGLCAVIILIMYRIMKIDIVMSILRREAK